MSEKSVYISYRRGISTIIAHTVFLDLHTRGYDVFMDTTILERGDLSSELVDQISARAHTIIILTPAAIDRFRTQSNPTDDWLYQEIVEALLTKRNVIPMMVYGFKLHDYADLFSGALSALHSYEALEVQEERLAQSMQRLHTRFLVQNIHGALKPLSPERIRAAQESTKDLILKPVPTLHMLHAERYYEAGYLQRIKGDYENAEKNYEAALALYPTYAIALKDRGIIHYMRGEMDAAIEAYTAAIQVDARDARFFNNRGLALMRRGDLPAAIADMTEALRLDSTFSDAYNNRGFMRYRMGDYAGAVEDATAALQLDPTASEALDTRAQAYFALGKYGLSQADYRKCYSATPGEITAIAGLAITHHVLQRIPEALRLWKMLIAKDERFRDAHWAVERLDWEPRLVDEARQLIARLAYEGQE